MKRIERFDLIIEIISNIPEDLNKSMMVNHIDERSYNAREYTEDNCKKFGIEYLPYFFDVDTHFDQDNLRLQGFHLIKLGDLEEYNIKQLKFLLHLITCSGFNKRWSLQYNHGDCKKTKYPCIEIWSAVFELPNDLDLPF